MLLWQDPKIFESEKGHIGTIAGKSDCPDQI